jgi:hypothetical protein
MTRPATASSMESLLLLLLDELPLDQRLGRFCPL